MNVADKNQMQNPERIKSLTLTGSAIIFGLPAVWFYLATRLITPWLTNKAGLHPSLSWFITGLTVFPLLFALALILARREGFRSITELKERLRLRKLSGLDWKYVALSCLAIFALMGLIMGISFMLNRWFGYPLLETTPPFLKSVTLHGSQRLYLLVWLVMFFFNMYGEELLWRGYVLPRMEVGKGKVAWLINGSFWLVFHFCFGLQLIILLLPILFVLPYAVQKTGNTNVGIVIHTILNGPMFVLISLGIIS
jgi:membrane protease YdiL (CAAX protease family)